ncbi:hypothetical protein Ancab_012079 [Ancistrocladus abbreviatus]
MAILGQHMHVRFLLLCSSRLLQRCVVLYRGQGRFHSSTTKTLAYMVRQPMITGRNLENISDYAGLAKQARTTHHFLPDEVRSRINSIQSGIDNVANFLDGQTKQNAKKIESVLGCV